MNPETRATRPSLGDLETHCAELAADHRLRDLKSNVSVTDGPVLTTEILGEDGWLC